MAVQVWAHRGNSSQFPENTMEAFSSALSLGADGLEIDIHLTSDDVVRNPLVQKIIERYSKFNH